MPVRQSKRLQLKDRLMNGMRGRFLGLGSVRGKIGSQGVMGRAQAG